MSDVYLDDYRLYAYLNGIRTDITIDAVSDPIKAGGWGMKEHKVGERVGGTGWLKFTLLDPTRKYIPDSITALSGWDIGTAIELEVSYDASSRLFRFYVKKIDPPGLAGKNKVTVTALDWTDYAATYPITNPGVFTNQRADDVLRTALGLGIIQPQNTSFAVGEEVFPTTFDTVTSQTKFYDEAVKAALSELGWIYLKKDRTFGETLVFDNASARIGTSTLSSIPKSAAESGFLLKEDDGYILKEDGGRIILNQVQDAVFDNSMLDFSAPYGENILNHATIWANPRRVDTSAQILFKLDQAFAIGSGKTFEFKGTYADPAGGLPINGQNMITPVATTDYLMNTKSDGSGTNITVSLTIVSITFGTEGYTAQLKNTNALTGWIIKFNVRGFGIYNYNPIQHLAQDQASKDAYGISSETADQKYKIDTYAGSIFVNGVVEEEKNPKTVLKTITFLANRSDVLMQAFLGLDISSLVEIKIDEINLDGYYFIQDVVEFSISPGGKVMCTWSFKQLLSLLLGLSMISVEFNRANNTGVNFDYLPVVSNIPRRTMCAWIYLTTAVTSGSSNVIAGIFMETGGDATFYIAVSLTNAFRAGQGYDVSRGFWQTADNTIVVNQWHHVAFSIDASNSANSPSLYIDGVPVAFSVSQAPSGVQADETGIPFVIGNVKTANRDYIDGFNGKIKDVRVYNRVLSDAEIASIYNAGTPDFNNVPDGLIFQAFAVRTNKLSSYVNQTLTDSLKVRDNIRGVVGTPHGGPIGRTP